MIVGVSALNFIGGVAKMCPKTSYNLKQSSFGPFKKIRFYLRLFAASKNYNVVDVKP